MPTTATANDVLNIMRSWLGFSEANGKFKEIIDLYNSYTPRARGYKLQYTDEWCAGTVTAAAIKAGAVDIIGNECSCNEFIKIFKQKGIWIEDGTIIPISGDIILYNWKSGIQPNDGLADHIGYVESVNTQAKLIIAIEGNKGEAVARRSIAIGHGNIRGFGRPKYHVESVVIAQPDPKELSDIAEGKIYYDKLMAYVRTLPVSDYALAASKAGIKTGWFTDGDNDGLVDDPRAFLSRQDLAQVLFNGGLLK